MLLKLLAKKIDFTTQYEKIILINEKLGVLHGINSGDKVSIKFDGVDVTCTVNLTESLVDEKTIGINEDIYRQNNVENGREIEVSLLEKSQSIEYIKNKIKGHRLNYDQMKSIIADISDGRLGTIEKTYFITTIYNPGFDEEELYSITKAMAESGEVLNWEFPTVDKHSIGGVAGKGITPIVISIAASFGLKLPNSSTRSITAPVGTTDILETVCKVSFKAEEIRNIVNTAGACMVWGGGLALAPADDELIKVERPMGIESYDKAIASIMAKKIAMGVKCLVLDLPAGSETKITHKEDIPVIKNKFIKIGEKFGIKVLPIERYPNGIDGNAVGARLEMREVLYILENNPSMSIDLRDNAVNLAGNLLELSGISSPGQGKIDALRNLQNGMALSKFKDIMKAQGGNGQVVSSDLDPKPEIYNISFNISVNGRINKILNKNVTALSRYLSCYLDKSAGIYFHKKPGDEIKVGEKAFTIYSSSKDRINLAISSYLSKNNLFEIVS